MEMMLRQIFILERMPAEVSPGDRALLIGAALVSRNGHGKHADGWKLTPKGEELFLDLYPE